MMKPAVKNSIKFGIIGLAVLALLWAFLIQFNRTSKCTWSSAMYGDGRVLGNAAQQYFLTTGQKSVTIGYDFATGQITGPLEPWVNTIHKGYSFSDKTIESENPTAFTMRHRGVRQDDPIPFSDEGKTTLNPAE